MMTVEDVVISLLNESYPLSPSRLRLMSITTLPSVYGFSSSSSSLSYFATSSTAATVSSTELNFEEFDSSVNGHNVVGTVLIVLILMVIIIGTVIGNILVCVAVCLVRKLRRPYNYLLVSLAVSDLCVAILVMPMALLYELLGEWQFGRMACDLWVSFDVLSCTASILNLCMISVDRYLAITKPLEYGVKRTPKRMVAYILFVWIGAACISVPPVLILGNEHGDGSICQVCQNFWYQICATFGSFYIPLTVMVTVYYKIFQAAKRIVDEERKAQVHLKLVEEQGKKSSVLTKSSYISSPSDKKGSPPPSGKQSSPR